MKKIFLIICLALGVGLLSGCARYSIGNWAVEPASQTARYNGPEFDAYVARHPDSTPERLHIVSEVNPKAGVNKLPKITGALTDTVSGGKKLDIYVETE